MWKVTGNNNITQSQKKYRSDKLFDLVLYMQFLSFLKASLKFFYLCQGFIWLSVIFFLCIYGIIVLYCQAKDYSSMKGSYFFEFCSFFKTME